MRISLKRVQWDLKVLYKGKVLYRGECPFDKIQVGDELDIGGRIYVVKSHVHNTWIKRDTVWVSKKKQK